MFFVMFISNNVPPLYSTDGALNLCKPFQNLEQLLHKTQRYSTLGARKLERKGKSVGMATALGHGLWAFFRIYIIKHGFLDGWPGFVLAFGNFEGTFYRYAKATTAKINWTNPPIDDIESK